MKNFQFFCLKIFIVKTMIETSDIFRRQMEFSNEEDRKIFLSPKTAQRIFSEQLRALVETHSGSSDTLTNLHEILIYHKKQYGYQMLPQSLGFDDMLSCIKSLPYIEVGTFTF